MIGGRLRALRPPPTPLVANKAGESQMHSCLNVDEIVRLVAWGLVASNAKATAVALAGCSKSLEDPVLDTLWETQNRLRPLLISLPGDIWKTGRCISFKRLPTTLEWARFRKYAQRMRGLRERGSLDVLSLEVFSTLQLCAINEPLFPNLKSLRLRRVTEALIPLIPMFLSPGITTISITSIESGTPAAVVASMITTLPTLCPNLREINFGGLPRDPVITAAVSGMLLSNNRNTLRYFNVDSPLTGEARDVIYRHPELGGLWVVIEGPTSLPTVALPNLVELDVEYDHDSGWLEGFRGATLGKLTSVTFRAGFESVDFLEAFESVALTTSATTTLSKFRFYTSYPWRPNYRSLFSFTQMAKLLIECPCERICSSSVDDDIISTLARTMPKLETLQLGDPPCREIPTGVTAEGLAVLARHCPDLSTLRIHFQVASFGASPVIDWMAPNAGLTALQRDCALTELEVGLIPVPEESVTVVALTLARIFPRISYVESVDGNWLDVMSVIRCPPRQAVDYTRTTLKSGN